MRLSQLFSKMHNFVSICVWLYWLISYCRACAGEDDLLLCRSCGHEVASSVDARYIASRLALSHRNNTMIGDQRATTQLFENPNGFQFEVVTFRTADVFKHWPADKRFTWYPGYSWTIATCPRCSAHLGESKIMWISNQMLTLIVTSYLNRHVTNIAMQEHFTLFLHIDRFTKIIHPGTIPDGWIRTIKILRTL